MPALSPEVRSWVEETTDCRVAGARQLRGGITSVIHQVSVHAASGSRSTVVLRQWPVAVLSEIGSAVEREPRALQLLEETDIPAPRLLGVSDGTRTGGVSAVLMTRLQGRVDLAPTDPRSSMAQMAQLLVRIHELDLPFPHHELRPRPAPEDVPAWAERRDIWQAAYAALQEPAPPHRRVFAHGDFQHFNLLWYRQKLTGIVDWALPCVSSPDLDVGHCRLNLAVLYGEERAEEFRHAYEAEAGRAVDPWWDLQRITAYSEKWQEFIPRQVAGRAPVDVAGMTKRVEDAIAGALRRLEARAT